MASRLLEPATFAIQPHQVAPELERRVRSAAGADVNWDAVGAVAEVLGGVATVATLAYLALQIRQSSAATRAQIRQSIADSQIHYLNSRSTDPFLRRATQDALAGRELDEGDAAAIRVHSGHVRRSMEPRVRRGGGALPLRTDEPRLGRHASVDAFD